MLNKEQIYKAILDKSQPNNFKIATVTALSPLTVKILSTDDNLKVISTTNLLGLRIGSRVLLQKFQNQLIATNVLGDVAIKWYDVPSNQSISGTDMVNITGLVFTLKANSGLYAIDVHMSARNDTSATPDIKFDWAVTGSDYTLVCARNCRGGEAQTNSSTTFTLCRNSAGHGIATDISYTLPALTTSSHITEHFLILAGATDTTFQYRASQISNDVSNPITISSYSHIIVTKLSEG